MTIYKINKKVSSRLTDSGAVGDTAASLLSVGEATTTLGFELPEGLADFAGFLLLIFEGLAAEVMTGGVAV